MTSPAQIFVWAFSLAYLLYLVPSRCEFLSIARPFAFQPHSTRKAENFSLGTYKPDCGCATRLMTFLRGVLVVLHHYSILTSQRFWVVR